MYDTYMYTSGHNGNLKETTQIYFNLFKYPNAV